MSELKVPSFAKGILETVLSPPVTLSKLAASSMFASVQLGIPSDIYNADFKIYYEDVLTKRSVLEVYAPGDETGWAVVYKEAVDDIYTGEIELIWGKWELFRGEADYSREAQKAKREAEAGLSLVEEIISEVAVASGLGPDDVDLHIEADAPETAVEWIARQDRENAERTGQS